MKKLLLIMTGLLLVSCGIDVDVTPTRPVDVNHNINISGIIEFCNDYAEEDVQQCIDDLTDLVRGANVRD